MKLSTLLTRVDAVQDRDRERISKILHDETGGQLMSVATQLELLRMDGVQGLEPVLEALELAFDSVRGLSRDVHPKLVERVGMAKALNALCANTQKRFRGSCKWEINDGSAGSADMYRIAEELLDNAIRHSDATTIELVFTSTGELIVRDDGVGFDPRLVPEGLGLLRVRYWGKRGHLQVRIRKGSKLGTMFRVTQRHAI